MTANAMPGDRELCLAAGMDDYISKPIRIEELTAVLEATPERETGDGAHAETLDHDALDNLLAMVGNDPDFVDELVDAYLSDAPQQAGAIRSALDAGDAKSLVAPAHLLKGISLNLGGVRVADIARAIEEHGSAGQIDGVDALLADLEAAHAELAAALGHARARRWARA
jgi:HPt (histidine-containing phosphotransfer) domain-containing protein